MPSRSGARQRGELMNVAQYFASMLCNRKKLFSTSVTQHAVSKWANLVKNPVNSNLIIRIPATGVAVRCEPRKKRAAAKNYFFSAEVSQNMRSTSRGGS